jgi:hypothetical protein
MNAGDAAGLLPPKGSLLTVTCVTGLCNICGAFLAHSE